MSCSILMDVPSYFDLYTNIVVYRAYAYYEKLVVLPRACLAEFPALWHPVRRNKTITFLNHLNVAHSFLGDRESIESFILNYKVGQALQHYRRRFTLPKDQPTRWWKDGHHFTEHHCFGLDISFKPFFKVLCVSLCADAYEELNEQEEGNQEQTGDV